MQDKEKLSMLVRGEINRRAKALADNLDDLPDISRLAGRLEPTFRQQFLRAVESTQNKIQLNELARKVLAGNVSGVEAAAHLDQFVEATPAFRATLARALEVGLGKAISDLGELEVVMNFALVNPKAVAAAEASAGILITNILDSQRDSIADIVRRSTNGEMDVYAAAKLIKQQIGLDPRRARAVEKFEQKLLEQGLSQDIIDKRVERYRQAQLKDRSLTIARTELIKASNHGQQLIWNEALEQGSIDKRFFQKQWIVTHDDRLDTSVCEPLDDAVAEIDGEFDSPIGGLVAPPAHPRCRCAMGLVRKAGRA